MAKLFKGQSKEFAKSRSKYLNQEYDWVSPDVWSFEVVSVLSVSAPGIEHHSQFDGPVVRTWGSVVDTKWSPEW